MELEKVVQTIWNRLWLILLGTLLVSVATFEVSRRMNPIYQARVILMVEQSQSAPLNYTSMLTGENLALTYSELLKTRPLLEIVIANLGLALSPDDLLEALDTRLIPDTQLLELTVQDIQPQRASDIANEIAFTFISLRNMEERFQNIVALEQQVITQIDNLGELIKLNQTTVDNARTTSSLLPDETSLAQTALSNQQNAYASLLGTYLNIQFAQAQLLDITVVEPAVASTEPIRPNIAVNTVLGASVGLVFSVGLAFLMEYLNRSFETADDVSEVLSLPTLGIIPRMGAKESQSRLVTAVLPHSPVSEAYRTLRTNIRFASVDEPLKTLLITSPEPRTGKSTVAANLSIVCALAGLRVVLLDADLRLPTLNHIFDLENHRGLTDLLVADEDVAVCLRRTEHDNLRLITSGTTPPNPSELLGSKRMETLLADIIQNADLVIIDSPPVLAVTDSAILASKVDGVILLVEANRTSHDAARHARETLVGVGANILGSALTKVKMKRRGSAYYYYSDKARPSRRQGQNGWRKRFLTGALRLPRTRHRRLAASEQTVSSRTRQERGSAGAQEAAYRSD